MFKAIGLLTSLTLISPLAWSQISAEFEYVRENTQTSQSGSALSDLERNQGFYINSGRSRTISPEPQDYQATPAVRQAPAPSYNTLPSSGPLPQSRPAQAESTNDSFYTGSEDFMDRARNVETPAATAVQEPVRVTTPTTDDAEALRSQVPMVAETKRSQQPAVKGSTRRSQALIDRMNNLPCQGFEIPEECLGFEKLNALRYVDIRDLGNISQIMDKSDPLPVGSKRYSTALNGTSNYIMEQMNGSGVQRFLSDLDLAPVTSLGNQAVNAKFYPSGPRGPEGEYENPRDQESRFHPTRDFEYTRRNSVLGVDFESIEELTPDRAFLIEMILFVHDDAVARSTGGSGFFFRRVQVLVDSLQELTSTGDKLEVTAFHEDIALEDTTFSVHGDILGRKVILHGKINNDRDSKDIYKVMPVAVGGVNIRTEGSMIQDITNRLGRRPQPSDLVDFETTEFPNGWMKKTDAQMTATPGTRSRILPGYYKARPFISFLNEDMQYKSIGMHYNMRDNARDIFGFESGFLSHGCIRTPDLYLYQLDAIINEGPHERIKATLLVRNSDFDWLQHPQPKLNNRYSAIQYERASSYGDPRPVTCKGGRKRSPNKFGNYQSIIERGCLQETTNVQGDVMVVVNYMLGRSDQMPRTVFADNSVQQRLILAERDRDNLINYVYTYDCYYRNQRHPNCQEALGRLDRAERTVRELGGGRAGEETQWDGGLF